MTQELLGRVHRELLDVLNSINQDKIHHDGDDFHELLNDVEKALAQPEQALCDLAEDGVCETLDCPNHPIEQEPVATVTSETGADITMSWWHEPALPIGTKLYTAPPQRTWVGLTGLDQKELMAMSARDAVFATEAKLKEKNT